MDVWKANSQKGDYRDKDLSHWFVFLANVLGMAAPV